LFNRLSKIYFEEKGEGRGKMIGIGLTAARTV
jgi:hypothetical protein